MSDFTLYDDDILLWSEQQAAAIRRLREMARGLPNELDIENVAEEIESVGRSELAAVESFLLQMLVHLLKLGAESEGEAADHWREETVAFGFGLRRRYATSMRQRIDMDEIWREACHLVTVGRRRLGPAFTSLPPACPIGLEDLLAEPIDVDGLVRCLDPDEPGRTQ
jgi:hypothetical protein